ncbi:MAG: uncharacterized protein JWO31_4162, partial [Phycisphaerales bacterium]|nr:uncharacterized protein [Phycisphaerales bacterium]
HDVQSGRYVGSARSLGSFFEFAADGSYKQYTLISVNNYGWVLTTWTEAYGTADFDAAKGVVTLTAAKGKYKVTDSRVAKNNYDRPMTDDEVKKQSDVRTFRIGRADNGDPRLELGTGDGKAVMAFKTWARADTGKSK